MSLADDPYIVRAIALQKIDLAQNPAQMPYIRRLNHRGLPPAGTDQLGRFTVCLVDGPWVRAHCQPDGDDFTNFGQHYRFSFIPKFEFWIDFYEANRSEQGFFLVHLLTEWQEMDNGSDYDDAYDRAVEVETRVRAKYQDISPDVDPLRARLRFWHECRDGRAIWLASEPFIHEHLSINWVEGGHWLVPGYQFEPKPDTWIGATLPPFERLVITGHELGENSRMQKGMKYPEAHKQISVKELAVRRDPDELPAWLESIGW